MFDELVDQAIEDATTEPEGPHFSRVKFTHIGQDQLAYKHQSNRADILRTLKLKAEVNQ